ncbi:proton-associated sugar transporter A [Drosophila grimshawi]|uniref:GH15639 n=1 Tax=Drosophila grimshawi TaxID=7222 RepID=B4J089_DROGR|nr:proton-associated sugar transporter A [Drosophila grimshawi]EDV95690.1 GH15639 [Drosophila grimshawi]
MVGVTADTAQAAQLSSANNPMIKYMLKQRENHAKEQDADYSHVFRRKTSFELYRLSAIAMAIEFAYAAETSFVTPILLQIGIDHTHMTMAWGLSPLIGFFVSPLLGSISDRCKLRWGRRRPIISLLSLGIFFGLVLVPYGKDLGSLLGDVGYNYTLTPPISNSYDNVSAVAALISAESEVGTSVANFKFAIILTIIGLVLLDFDADTCQTPARTYLLDMCLPEEQSKALTTFTLFAGFGGTIGYAIGGIDWETTQIGTFLGGNIPTVFSLVTIIFIICYLITITTFREIPLKLIESDELLRPLSETAIKRELKKNNNAIYYIQETTTLELQMANDLKTVDTINGYQNSSGGQIKTLDVNTEIEETPKVSLCGYLKSIFIMPHSMRMLALTNLFCWMGHVTYCLYFTDFVGQAVFNGDPQAPPNSLALQLYNEGVRFGCWGMSIYAFSCSIYSLTVTKLMKWFGTKAVYISGMIYYGVGMLILGLWPTKWGVLFFSTSAGILYGTLFTMPYILVANYHSKNCFRVRNGETVPLKQARGLGTDVAIISSMVFVAQLVVALCVGPLIDWVQGTCAILYASTFLSFTAAIFAMFVLYV